MEYIDQYCFTEWTYGGDELCCDFYKVFRVFDFGVDIGEPIEKPKERRDMFINKSTERNVMGVQSIKGKIKFEYSAPEASGVSLVGNFNQWNSQANPMKKDKKGIWKATLSLEPGRYEYRFFSDGNWENDPSCSCSVDNEFGGQNCVRIVA